MRRIVTFHCEQAQLAGTLDAADGTTGLLIVSGGNEIRIGAHRGMARFAATLGGEGSPVFRFDRRGVGDSAGVNQGYATSGPDIVAAVAAFRRAQPQLKRIVGFGNCDAATALVIQRGTAAIDALLLANPWIVEPLDDLPPPAAIKDRYVRRLRDPAAWAALLTGKVDMGLLARGLGRLAMAKRPTDLAGAFAEALADRTLPTHILLAARDGTALAFEDAWGARALLHVTIEKLDSASHSFATDEDFAALCAAARAMLAG